MAQRNARNKKLTVPPFPNQPEGEGFFYDVPTFDLKVVADYSGLTMLEVWNLRYFTYCRLLRDSIIYQLSRSDDGIERLKEAYAFEQTAPDLNAIETFNDDKVMMYGE